MAGRARERVIGWGDELIAAGQARLLSASTTPQRKVVIFDRNGQQREHEAWRANPAIATRSENVFKPHHLTNGPGVRPYIAAKSDRQWTWRAFTPTPAQIFFNADEADRAERAGEVGIVLEPNNKAKASPNKDWGYARWQALAALLAKEGFRVSQLGPAGTRRMQGVKLIETPNFRYGAAVLARAQGAILPEGGLHHAAAATGTPAVVIFGGFISPRQTGYAQQTNLFTADEPCGMRIACPHCRRALDAIEPEQLVAELKKRLAPQQVAA